LERHGIETKIHYPIPIHRQPAAAHLGYGPGSFPVCERQATRILSLPIHEFLGENQQAYVVETIEKFYRG
jgi:dTDP-4-amino-4,6-dideoxygalactose transaminase